MTSFYICLAVTLFLPAAGTLLIQLLTERTFLKNLPRRKKTIVTGLLFAFLAILQSETSLLASRLSGMVATMCSAAILPVCAGLLFDSGAGIIAGVVCAVYRVVPVFRSGCDTVVLCQGIVALSSGIGAYLIRRALMEEKRPDPVFCCFTALTVVALSVVVLQIADNVVPGQVASLTDGEFFQMVAVDVTSLLLPALLIRKRETGNSPRARDEKRSSGILRPILLITMVFLVVVTGLFAYIFDTSILRRTVVTAMKADVRTMVGMIDDDPELSLTEITQDLQVYSTGYFVIADGKGNILTDSCPDPDGWQGESETLSDIGIALEDTQAYTLCDSEEIHGVVSSWMYDFSRKYIVIGVVPDEEIYAYREPQVRLTICMEYLLMYGMTLMINYVFKRCLARDAEAVRKELGKLTGKVDPPPEKTDFTMLDVTGSHQLLDIAKQAAGEMRLAGDIQRQALPLSPATFSGVVIHAFISPARQVGGDFYDYFTIDSGRVAFLVADVSGKGIGAAMFMMRAKAAIRAAATDDSSPEEILRKANDSLCEGNQDCMFVTAWMGIIETDTGVVRYVNAAQGMQIVRDRGEDYAEIPDKPEVPLGLSPGKRYTLHTMTLRPGSRLFLYTDGVTEACDEKDELYGEEKLLRDLNERGKGKTGKNTLEEMVACVKEYAGDAVQSDDITMLCLDYIGPVTTRTLSVKTVRAEDGSLDDAWGFVEGAIGCDADGLMEINLAFEEMFVNVCHYAYPEGTGDVSIGVSVENGIAVIRLTDSGVPFNPLRQNKKQETVPLHERREGGLGITLVKECMDYLEYEYKDGKNLFTMAKCLV